MPSDHLAYLIRDLVIELDLSAFYGRYKYSRGAAPFDPRMMVGILLYAWASSVYSSRKIALLCVGDLGGRFLAAGHQPDFRTISTFRLQHGKALEGLFAQSVRLCQKAGMVSLGHVAMDGSKFAANASKHKAMSYGRMLESEERLRKEIAEYQRLSREADAEEDTLFGREHAGADLPEELKRRETRLARLRAAREALEAEEREAAQAKAEAKQQARAELELEAAKAGKGVTGRKPAQPKESTGPNEPDPKEPDPKTQRNFTDPESRIMRSGRGEWVQGFNGQAAVDSDYQIIVACDLTNQGDDTPHLKPLLAEVIRNAGSTPAEVSADAGYFSKANIEAVLALSAQPLIPPDRMPLHETDGSEVPLDKIADPEQVGSEPMRMADWMRIVLSTEEGAKAYARRKTSVEPVFGQIKGSPGSPGFHQVLRRGLVKARQEWLWVCATHNFRKYLRHQKAVTT